jgi:dihydrofolate synthase/folylpolyglutamate synthase
MEWLGPTREHIGREKAGIFRAQRPAVLATPVLPASVFSEADRIGAVLRIAGRDFSVRQGAETWGFHGRVHSLVDLPLPALAGDRQIHNAAAALAALECLALNHRRLAVWPAHASASHALAELKLPGRLQHVAGPPEWLLDVAHNPAAAAVVAAHLKRHRARGRQWAVLGMLADKDAAGVVGELADVVDGWWLCSLTDSERGRTAAQLASKMPPSARVLAQCATVAEACARARSAATPDDRILVCGSFSTVGPALDYLGV